MNEVRSNEHVTRRDILFSVVIPSYNRPEQLVRQLHRLTEQRFRNFEVIVVLQGVLVDFTEFQDFPLSSIHFRDAIGVSKARNEGAAIARGEFLIFLDDDDVPDNNWLMAFAKMSFKVRSEVIMFCGIRTVRLGGIVASMPRVDLMTPPLAGAWALSSNTFRSLGGYDERLSFSENSELLIRLKLYGCRAMCVEEIHFSYHPAKRGGGSNPEMRIHSIQIILDKHKSFFDQNIFEKRNYLRVLGVSLLRLDKPADARRMLMASWLISPWDLLGLLRLLVSVCPRSVRQKIYS